MIAAVSTAAVIGTSAAFGGPALAALVGAPQAAGPATELRTYRWDSYASGQDGDVILSDEPLRASIVISTRSDLVVTLSGTYRSGASTPSVQLAVTDGAGTRRPVRFAASRLAQSWTADGFIARWVVHDVPSGTVSVSFAKPSSSRSFLHMTNITATVEAWRSS